MWYGGRLMLLCNSTGSNYFAFWASNNSNQAYIRYNSNINLLTFNTNNILVNQDIKIENGKQLQVNDYLMLNSNAGEYNLQWANSPGSYSIKQQYTNNGVTEFHKFFCNNGVIQFNNPIEYQFNFNNSSVFQYPSYNTSATNKTLTHRFYSSFDSFDIMKFTSNGTTFQDNNIEIDLNTIFDANRLLFNKGSPGGSADVFSSCILFKNYTFNSNQNSVFAINSVGSLNDTSANTFIKLLHGNTLQAISLEKYVEASGSLAQNYSTVNWKQLSAGTSWNYSNITVNYSLSCTQGISAVTVTVKSSSEFIKNILPYQYDYTTVPKPKSWKYKKNSHFTQNVQYVGLTIEDIMSCENQQIKQILQPGTDYQLTFDNEQEADEEIKRQENNYQIKKEKIGEQYILSVNMPSIDPEKFCQYLYTIIYQQQERIEKLEKIIYSNIQQ